MAVSFKFSPELESLVRAIGLMAADGAVDPDWFEHPLERLRTIVSNPVQRAALLDLLDRIVPPEPGGSGSATSARLYPLLDRNGPGNIYLSVDDTTLGVVAAIATPVIAVPRARVECRLPLVDLSNGLRAIAGSPGAPLTLSLEAGWPAGAHPSGVAAVASIEVSGAGSLRIRLQDLDPAAPPGTVTEFDPTRLGPEAVQVITALLQDLLARVAGPLDPMVSRLAAHLPGVLGLMAPLEPLPIDRLLADPAALRRWFGGIAGRPDRLKAWFTHLSHLAGAGLPAVSVPVLGAGTPSDLLRVPMIALGQGAAVELTLAAFAAGGGRPGRLQFGIALQLSSPIARVDGGATVLSIPLDAGGTPVLALESAHLKLVAPAAGKLIDRAPAIEVGQVAAGFAWDGTTLQPCLEIDAVVIDAVPYARIDLSHASAVVDAARAGVAQALRSAMGSTGDGKGQALATLLGLAPPISDPTSPHGLDLGAFVREPTRAIAAVHRQVLGDPVHHWGFVFADLAGLLGFTTSGGQGTADSPWQAVIAAESRATLSLVAWNAHSPGAGPAQLRLGVRVGVAAAPWSARWQAELLSFDLPDDGRSVARISGGQRLSLALDAPQPAPAASGLAVTVDSLCAGFAWVPGNAPNWSVTATGLVLTTRSGASDPITLELPGRGFDLSRGDLGLGIPVSTLFTVGRLLVAEAVHGWGDSAAYRLAALIGVHRDIAGLPADWPLLELPDAADIGSLLVDLPGVVRRRLLALASGVSASGTPFPVIALQLLRATLDRSATSAFALSLPQLSGSGRHDDPWAFALGDAAAELIGWLEPDGPAPAGADGVITSLARASSATSLLALLQQTPLPDTALRAACMGRDPATAGAELDRLGEWLALGDGVVAADAQTVDSALWTTGRPVIGAHPMQPGAVAAIDQIVEQLATWAGAAPHVVLLLGPGFSDHRIWRPLLARLAPDRADGAHFDLRVPGMAVSAIDLGRVDAIAGCYTVDLPLAARDVQVAQLARVVERAAHLTGLAQVYLVAHSSAGVVAREFAAGHAPRVAGIVTLGSPHSASPFEPRTDVALAGGIRLARLLLPGSPDTPDRQALAAALHQLGAAIDAAPGYADDAFTGAAADLQDTVPGLAIPGWLGGDLLGRVVDALLARAASAQTGRRPPTHAAFGLRLSMARPPVADGIGVRASLRFDAARVALGAGVELPGRPARAISARLSIERPGAWLVGDAAAERRLRRIDIEARVALPDVLGSAGPTVSASFDLHELAMAGVASDRSGLDVLIALAALPARVPLAASAPEPGTADAFVLGLLQAAGIVVDDPFGGFSLALDELQALAKRPAERLRARAGRLVDAAAQLLGAVRGSDGAWVLAAAQLPFELVVGSDAPFDVQLRGTASAGGLWQLADGLSLALAARLALPSFALSASTTVRLGAARLVGSTDSGQLTLDTGRGLPVTLWPAPPPDALRRALVPRLPGLLAPPLVSAVLGGMLGGRVSIRGLDVLLSAPGEWLLSDRALGREDGSGFDAAKLAALLHLVADAVGLARAPDGIVLPAGVTLSAIAGTPLLVELAGTIALDAVGDQLGLHLALGIDGGLRAHAPLRVTPSGAVSIDVALPGSWGRVGVSIGAGPDGIDLSVLAGGQTIVLLPTFSGFGALAAGATALLPHVLQAIVGALSPGPQAPTGLLRGGLQVARAFGIYDFDAAGFETAARSAALARLLDPDWLATQVASAPAVITALAPLFVDPDPLIDLPGTFSVVDTTLQWRLPIAAAGIVEASLGWTGSGAGASPLLAIALHAVPLGPVVLDALSVGYDGTLDCRLDLHLDAGGEFGFLKPAFGIALDVGAGAAALAGTVYPLGAGSAADLALFLPPRRAPVISARAPWMLLEQWGVPLVAKLLVTAFDAKLDAALWSGGPTVGAVLDGSGLTLPGTRPARLASPLPPVATLGLRALLSALQGVPLTLTPTLQLEFVTDAALGRRGLRLYGSQVVEAGDLAVSLRFGDATWLKDPAAGVTLWLLQDQGGPLPVKIAPGLGIVGLGAVIGGAASAPLLDGAVSLGAIGGFVFLDAGFVREQNGVPEFALSVSGIGAGLELDSAMIRVAGDDGDGFLQKILPAQLQAPFDLALSWRDGAGLAVYGGSSPDTLEATWPLDVDLRVMRLEELYVALTRDGAATRLQAAMSGRADIGPLHASIQRVGLAATFAPGGTRFGLRAPDGVGLSLDAGIVSGGGFLWIDEARGQYAGGIQLHLETLSLAAIGLINTRLPDGSPIPGPFGLPGFSLVIIITADFPPIQLGFGFTLDGIGGLLGLNRTIDVPTLRAGARDHALDTLMFPRDPAANAARIVRTLTSVFPIALDRFVIGPMVRLGWGTPTILTLDIAILIEIPAPVVVALLGRMRLALPRDDESAVVRINLDVIGILDFGAGEVSIDAVLYDSVVAGFALTGGMALRARWKQDPAFALAIGGFHPAFKPPAGFPALERMAISLATGDNPRLRLEAYLAVTSNTVQFGARVDFHAEAAGCAADAMLSFDALIYLSPFGLQADVAGMAAITFNGAVICAVSLALSLSGPSPWHVRGRAEVQLLIVKATISFDARIGADALPPPTPPADVGRLLADAVAQAANWSAQPPVGAGCITLRQRAGEAGLVAHPLGRLEFRQRLVPFGSALDHFGASSIAGPDRFDIDRVALGGRVLVAGERSDLADDFAPAQFFSLTDEEKLSRPSFESFLSGVALHFDAVDVDALGAEEAAVFDFDYIVIDDAADGTTPPGLSLSAALAIGLAPLGAAAVALSRHDGMQRFAAPPAGVSVAPARFQVRTDDLAGNRAGKSTGAVDFRNRTLAARAAQRLRADSGGEAAVVRVTEPAL